MQLPLNIWINIMLFQADVICKLYKYKEGINHSGVLYDNVQQ